MTGGRFGPYGGQYMPETLMNAVLDVERSYECYKKEPSFQRELSELLQNYAGRPSILYFAEKIKDVFSRGKAFIPARSMAAYADGVIVGSAIVKLVEQYGGVCVKPVADYVRQMKKAIS